MSAGSEEYLLAPPYTRHGREAKRGRLRWILLFLLVVGAGWAVYATFYAGPSPEIRIATERPAIGSSNRIDVSVVEPRRGLGKVRLTLVQGENSIELARDDGAAPAVWKLWQKGPETVELSAVVGRGAPDWLREGEATLRVVAERLEGPLRSVDPSVVETTLPVRFRPPALSMLSGPLYVRQGGSGLVVFRPGPTSVRSGIVAGDAVFPSYPLPGATSGERVVLFGVPWNVASIGDVKLFAEDDAGNVAMKQAPDLLKASPPRRDTIGITDTFLERVVPAIVSQTPELDPDEPFLEAYLRINGELRRANRQFLAELAGKSVPQPLWQGRFVQLPNSARKASFAETRRYLYRGSAVDEQTHLGLDLASTSRALAPAPNAGVILYAGFLGIYGNVVVIDHGLGMMSINAHLSSIAVAEGQRVERGAAIGRTGATGLAGGDHLHLGIFIQGTAVDPIEWLDGTWIENNIASKLDVTGAAEQGATR